MTEPKTVAHVPAVCAPESGRDLLRLAIRAGVFSEDTVHQFLRDHPLAGVADPREAAEILVHTDQLSHLHAELLLLGCPNATRLGRYELIDVIGRGGMATVFLAEDAGLKRQVAVKVMRALGELRDVRERFRRETLAAATLTHPNVVRTYDFGEHDGVPYLVMERLTGRTLHAARQRGPLSVVEVVDALRQTALGLHAVHAAGLVHRDVKPGNVMLCRDGAIKLLDLGLVRFTLPDGHEGTNRHKPLTRLLPAMSFVGTPQYLAPEQALHSSAADHRADLFGLGAVLHYLVTGRPPRVELPPHLTPAPPADDLRVAFADLPATLADLGVRLLATSPESRPQSAQEVADELDALQGTLETQPNIAKRTGVIPRQPRPVPVPPPQTASAAPTVVEGRPVGVLKSRRKLLLAAGGAAMLLAAGLAAVAVWANARRAGPAAPAVAAVPEPEVLIPAGKPVRGLALSPDKRLAAVTAFDGQTQLWDVVEKKAVRVLPGGGSRVTGTGFTADGRLLVFGSSRTTIGIWDTHAEVVAATFEASEWLVSAAISPDGSRVAAGDRAGTTWLWDVATGNGRRFAHEAKPRADVVAFVPGRSLPVTGYGSRGEVRAWTDAGFDPFQQSESWVPNGLCVTGGRVVTAAAAELAVLDAGTVVALRAIRSAPQDAPFACVAGGPGGKWVVTGGSDGRVRVWDLATGAPRAVRDVVPQPLAALAVAADGTEVLAASADGAVRRVPLGPVE